MKHFIRLRLKNLTAIGLSLCMAATFAVPFFAYPDQLMADTQDDLDAVNKQLEELRNKQSELNASYGELNEKLSASGEKLSSIEDAVNAKQSEIDDTNIQVADMQAEIDQQYAAMKLRIQFMYENNNATILSTLLSAESLSDLLSKSEYIQQISNYDHQKMQELSDLLASLKETQAKLEQEMAELVTLKDDAAREADNFAVLLSQCQTELDTTSDSITDAEALALEYEKQIEQEMLERQRREMEALEAAKKAQEEADKVREVGGLFILGTERHDSRRIDNQLRGRSGRQGDPGESQFFLSLEDDLMRLFGGERMQAMMARLTDDENMPIESKMITRTVESSQKKVEGRNFGIRKQTLQYDDVMNRQRQLIYKQRDQVLDGIDLTDKILQMLDTNIEENVKNYFAGDHKADWNVAGLKEKYKGWLTTEDDFNDDIDMLSVQGTIDMLQDRGHKRLEEKRELLGDEMFQDFERMVLLRNVDVLWMDNIDAMDDLKQGIHLRAYAQQDPVVAFRMESYDMFDEMTATIRENTVRMMLTIMPRRQEDVERKAVAKVTATSSGGDDTVKATPVRKGKKVGPNDPCPCGSGKKYKKCCGAPGKEHND